MFVFSLILLFWLEMPGYDFEYFHSSWVGLLFCPIGVAVPRVFVKKGRGRDVMFLLFLPDFLFDTTESQVKPLDFAGEVSHGSNPGSFL